MTTAAVPVPRTTTRQKPAITRDRLHRYTYAGITYPGLTNRLKVIDKSDALMSWAARNTAEAAVAQLDNLAGLRDTVGPDGVVKALTARSGWKRDEAASIGSAIHGMAELVVHGKPLGDLSDVIRHRVERYALWWEASGWKLRLAEAFVVHTALGYGGTLDLLAYDEDGRTVLADIKTGTGVYGETRLQLLGYGEAEVIAPQSSPVAYPMPPVQRYAVLHVTERGVETIEVAIDDGDREALRACLRLAAWHDIRKGRLAA